MRDARFIIRLLHRYGMASCHYFDMRGCIMTNEEKLVSTLLKVREALYNVPCVDEIYDQQHSDTHMQAVIDIDAALRSIGVLK